MRKAPKNKKEAAPARKELHPKAVAFGERVRSQWRLDDAALGLLEEAIENLSIAMHSRDQLKAEGTVLATKTGYRVAHPAFKIAKEASALFTHQIKALNLEIEVKPTE